MPDKLFLCCILGFLTVPFNLKAESCVEVMDADGIPTPTFVSDGRLYALEPAFEDYYFMLEDACDAWGIAIDTGCDIYPMMGAIEWNAVATICNSNKVIIYDRRLSSNIGYDGAQAVFAHELGHHICGHIGTSAAESKKRELEADRFAGATMQRIGFSREAALSYALILMQQPSNSHPASAEREAALLAGWDDPQLRTVCSAE